MLGGDANHVHVCDARMGLSVHVAWGVTIAHTAVYPHVQYLLRSFSLFHRYLIPTRWRMHGSCIVGRRPWGLY